ncbi:hypothetical protein [Microbulbifer sp.]|uniref:hypothetical protein n=1 Tax=Microbulbifer sp. TaxID=1908541 RepID=UPI003F376C02
MHNCACEKDESQEWLARLDRLPAGERYHHDWVADADAARLRAWRALGDQEAIAPWQEQPLRACPRPRCRS